MGSAQIASRSSQLVKGKTSLQRGLMALGCLFQTLFVSFFFLFFSGRPIVPNTVSPRSS